MISTWPDGRKHAMSQSQHRQWNAANYPGTRQLCDKCGEPTGRCEEDSITDNDGNAYCDKCAECETCQGVGMIDETLGGAPRSNPETECPDCNGTGTWLVED